MSETSTNGGRLARPRPAQFRRRRVTVALLGLVLAAGGVAWVVRSLTSGHGTSTPTGPVCRATVGTSTYPLDREQARSATAIAGVAKRMGLPNHAVTVALAAALQESQLHNLTYGDRDSLGLFQQRPSQGWGTPAQILDPAYAAAAFYQGLGHIAGWEALPVTVAAQRVQRSAAPDAYARWEPEARVLAQVLTGEVAAGLSCQATGAATPPTVAAVAAAMRPDFGTVALDQPLPVARGWTVATWIVARADDLHVGSVAYAGHTWTAASGRWSLTPAADQRVRLG
ncbi:MAG: hypothetical protein JWN46_1403 [Acidimicrobiales bacterium]|nr:hypothetical protein [Acidimicrobiales bacterium]